MMWKTWVTALGIGAGLALAAAAPTAHAFDRKDGTTTSSVITDPSTDIVDFYAWMQTSDAKRVNLVMTVNPDAGNSARFSTTALYVFHINARTTFADTNPNPEAQIICRFDGAATQNMECWLGQNQYVKAPINQKTASADNGIIAYAGLRNDPFFANEAGLSDAMNTIMTTLNGKTRDAAGCYAFSTTEQTSVKSKMALPANTDSYKGKNVLAIVLTVDTTLLAPSGKPVLSVWASTNKPL